MTDKVSTLSAKELKGGCIWRMKESGEDAYLSGVLERGAMQRPGVSV